MVSAASEGENEREVEAAVEGESLREIEGEVGIDAAASSDAQMRDDLAEADVDTDHQDGGVYTGADAAKAAVAAPKDSVPSITFVSPLGRKGTLDDDDTATPPPPVHSDSEEESDDDAADGLLPPPPALSDSEDDDDWAARIAGEVRI